MKQISLVASLLVLSAVALAPALKADPATASVRLSGTYAFQFTSNSNGGNHTVGDGMLTLDGAGGVTGTYLSVGLMQPTQNGAFTGTSVAHVNSTTGMPDGSVDIHLDFGNGHTVDLNAVFADRGSRLMFIQTLENGVPPNTPGSSVTNGNGQLVK